MVKVLVLFGKPLDKVSFDQHLEHTHRPLLARLPGLAALQIDRVAGAATGDSPFHLVVELQFASEEAMHEGLNSEVGQAMARDFSGFASGGVTILLCESHSEPVGTVIDGE
ncbi:MAG: EthD family reductase [Gemmatimonadales bacterium]|jgi:uncharacterized protein (TIGR02118 family)